MFVVLVLLDNSTSDQTLTNQKLHIWSHELLNQSQSLWTFLLVLPGNSTSDQTLTSSAVVLNLRRLADRQRGLSIVIYYVHYKEKSAK